MAEPFAISEHPALALILPRDAIKALATMPRKERAQIREGLQAIAAEPHHGVEAMQRRPHGRFRVRQGGWRAIFSIDGADVVVDRILDGEHPLRVWREHRGMSLRGLATASGVAFNYISEIEGGRKPGSADAVRRLAAALGVAMEDLMPVVVNDDDEGAPGFEGEASRGDG